MRTVLHATAIEKKISVPLSNTDFVVLQKDSYKGQISPVKTARFLGVIVLLLALAHALTVWNYIGNQESFVAKQLQRLFSLGNDGNIPTLFSSFILFAASVLLFYASKTDTRKKAASNKKRWMLLSMIFLFLAVDEGAMIHDFLNEAIRSKLPGDVPDFLYLAWVIPYFFLVVAVALYFAKFLFLLPGKTRNLFILSGFLYVLGALGFELIESSFIAHTAFVELEEGVKPLQLHAYELVEEVLEMGGIVLFIYALLDYLKAGKKVFFFNFSAR